MPTSAQLDVDAPPDGSGPGSAARAALLDAVIDHLATHGVGDLSLRPLAEGVGTSHRMLLYHFGSKEQLLVAVVDEVEARQRAVLAELAEELDQVPAGAEARAAGARVSRRFW